jgi:hypothetical protein
LGELWRYTSPYRGLAAMEEKDSDYFFGRERKTVDVISALIAAADQLRFDRDRVNSTAWAGSSTRN